VKIRPALVLSLAALVVLPASAHANILFDGGFETGSLSQWPVTQMCAPDRATVYSASSQPTWPAPASGSYALRFHVLNSDVSPCTPTSNPRAQILGSNLAPGDDRWETFQAYFPASFPNMSSWFLFQEDYGAPYNGSPPLGFGVHTVNGVQQMDLSRGAQYNYDTIWKMPLTKGHWYTFLVHKRFAKDSSGFVELWVDGQPQTFSNGQTRMYTQTMHSDATGSYQFYLNSYRAINTASVVDTFFDGARIGTTRADVDWGTISAPAPTPTPTPTPTGGGTGSGSPPPPIAALTAAFTYSPTNPVHRRTLVHFDGSTSQGAVAYRWSLDGYTYLSGVQPTFTFQHVGTKHVTLTVTDANGNKASVEHDVVVR
jgi:PKD repeat protein